MQYTAVSPLLTASSQDAARREASARQQPHTHATRGGRRDNLPAPLTSFVGRDAEIASAKRMLGTSRMLTLVGTGGIGKTRLALQLAKELTDRYTDKV